MLCYSPVLLNCGLQTVEPAEPAEPIFFHFFFKKKYPKKRFLKNIQNYKKNCDKILFTNTEKNIQLKPTACRCSSHVIIKSKIIVKVKCIILIKTVVQLR